VGECKLQIKEEEEPLFGETKLHGRRKGRWDVSRHMRCVATAATAGATAAASVSTAIIFKRIFMARQTALQPSTALQPGTAVL
jgi:hypothetical protein